MLARSFHFPQYCGLACILSLLRVLSYRCFITVAHFSVHTVHCFLRTCHFRTLSFIPVFRLKEIESRPVRKFDWIVPPKAGEFCLGQGSQIWTLQFIPL